MVSRERKRERLIDERDEMGWKGLYRGEKGRDFFGSKYKSIKWVFFSIISVCLL